MIDMMDMMLKMLQALIDARIEYWEKKQGDKSFHEDIIEELRLLKNVVNPMIKREE